VRATIDDRPGKLGEKYTQQKMKEFPYMLIVGIMKKKGGTVTVRACMQDVDRSGVELDSFLKALHEECESSPAIANEEIGSRLRVNREIRAPKVRVISQTGETNWRPFAVRSFSNGRARWSRPC